MRLTQAQILWLHDVRPYSHPWRDRTFRALIKKGAVVTTDDKDFTTGRCGYAITAAGRAALDQANAEAERR